MTRENANGSKKMARLLQRATGWSYSECKRCVETMSVEKIKSLIERRATPNAADGGREGR